MVTFDPGRICRFWPGRPLHALTWSNSLLSVSLVGLADRVQPTLGAILSWM